MNRHLLDVNVLCALAWPRHEFHAFAHTWFARSGSRAWATNPVSQLGVLRLLTNPAVTSGAVSAQTALHLLAEVIRYPNHEFWPLDHDLPSLLQPVAGAVQGHQQWTDALLLLHAAERDGILVTFDSGMKQLATGELSGHLLLLKHR